MIRALNSFKQFFSKYESYKIVHVIMLILSLIIVVILTPISIIESDSNPKKCHLDQTIYITQNQESIYSNFTSFLSKTKKSLDISLSFPEDVMYFPKFWNETFKSLLNKHISVRVFTNNQNLRSDQNFELRYLRKDKIDNEFINFYMSFAVSDEMDIFYPSTFYVNDSQNTNENQTTCSYIVQLNNCISAGKDLTSLFNILWAYKSENRRPLKRSFLSKNSTTKTFSFLVEPTSEFSRGFANITSTLYDFMSLSYLNKYIMTCSVFPDLNKITSNKLKVDLSHKSALTSSLFEVAEEIVDDQETYLMISFDHFNDHKTKFLSMISNMIPNSTSVCKDIHIQGTIIASSSVNISKLFLLQSGIPNVFTGDLVLGLSINVDSLVFNRVSALFSNNNCVKLKQPTIEM